MPRVVSCYLADDLRMAKLRLLLYLLATITFLLSQWLIPLWAITAAVTTVQTLWIKITLCVVALVWLLIFRPWTIFIDKRFPGFIAAVRQAVIELLS